MTINIGMSFFAYNNGVLENHVSGKTIVNEYSEAQQKARDFVSGYYSSADDMTIVRNQKYPEIGSWEIVGRSNSDPDMGFMIIISKLN